MSESERQLIKQYWQEVGGTLILEYPAVEEGENHGRRRIDGVIIKNEAFEQLDPYSTVPIEDKDIISVQCKTNRLGMYLMGQAYFSMHLLKRHNPASIHSIALCGEYDDVLGPIFNSYPNCEVVVIK